jgi:hypothetical protein
MEESRNAGRTGVHGWSRHYGQGRIHVAPSDDAGDEGDEGDDRAGEKPKHRPVAKRRHRRP